MFIEIITIQINCSPQDLESSACFRRGTYIELSTGVLRRVEDIRTEDFIQSALRSQQFDLKEATVVKIDRTSMQMNNITFSYDMQHLKVGTFWAVRFVVDFISLSMLHFRSIWRCQRLIRYLSMARAGHHATRNYPLNFTS